MHCPCVGLNDYRDLNQRAHFGAGNGHVILGLAMVSHFGAGNGLAMVSHFGAGNGHHFGAGNSHVQCNYVTLAACPVFFVGVLNRFSFLKTMPLAATHGDAPAPHPWSLVVDSLLVYYSNPTGYIKWN